MHVSVTFTFSYHNIRHVCNYVKWAVGSPFLWQCCDSWAYSATQATARPGSSSLDRRSWLLPACIYWRKLSHFDADTMHWSIGPIRLSKTLKHTLLSWLHIGVLINRVLRNIIGILAPHRREYICHHNEDPPIQQWLGILGKQKGAIWKTQNI